MNKIYISTFAIMIVIIAVINFAFYWTSRDSLIKNEAESMEVRIILLNLLLMDKSWLTIKMTPGLMLPLKVLSRTILPSKKLVC